MSRVKDTRAIKGIMTQVKRLEGEVDALKLDISTKQKELSAKQKAVDDLYERINRLCGSDAPRISDHAIVRYMERIKGVDISAIEEEILTEEVLGLIEKLGGSGAYPNKDFQVMMKNNTVITVIKK